MGKSQERNIRGILIEINANIKEYQRDYNGNMIPNVYIHRVLKEYDLHNPLEAFIGMLMGICP